MGKLAGKIRDMGELAASKERKVGKFKEYVLYAVRCVRAPRFPVGLGVYGDNIEEEIRIQSIPMGEVLFRTGIRSPLAHKLEKVAPRREWGREGWNGSSDSTLVLTDFAPWNQYSLESFRLSAEKERRERRPN